MNAKAKTVYEYRLDGKVAFFSIQGPRAKNENTLKATKALYPNKEVTCILREDLDESKAKANNGALIELKLLPF